jgi:TfoX/Sxy family transcriptional regulator of competence genes
MAYDKKLANRVHKILENYKNITEKEMFGGMAFLMNGKMCCGVIKNNLVIRVGPKNYGKALTKSHVSPMDFTGKPLKGFVYVNSRGYKSSKTLTNWVNLGVDYVNSL